MAPRLGVRNGALTLLSADRTNGMKQEPMQVLQGGLRAKYLPMGLSLLADAKLERHSRFILIVDNDATSVSCILAAHQLDCVCIMLSRSRLHLLEHAKQQTGISTVVTPDSSTQSIHVEDGASPSSSWSGHAALKGNGGLGMLTSGSISQAKVVMNTWDAMLCQGHSTQKSLFPSTPAQLVCCTSISHAYSINALFSLLTSPHDAQSELVFPSTDQLHSLLSESTSFKRVLFATPATYTQLQSNTYPSVPFHVDIPFSAGSKLSPALFQSTQSKYGIHIFQNYGSSETGNIAAWGIRDRSIEEELDADRRSQPGELYVGSLWPGVYHEMRDGEAMIKTPWQSLGYVRNQELELHQGGVHATADLVVVESSTNGTLVRLKQRIRPRITLNASVTIDPNALEQELKEIDTITDALVMTQREDSIVRVKVVTEDGEMTEALKRQCERVVGTSQGLELEVVDFLPCSPAGKLLYYN